MAYRIDHPAGELLTGISPEEYGFYWVLMTSALHLTPQVGYHTRGFWWLPGHQVAISSEHIHILDDRPLQPPAEWDKAKE